MIIYIDSNAVPDTENIPNEVFKYLLNKAKIKVPRYRSLERAYLGKNKPLSIEKDEVKVNINYVKHVVDMLRFFYLGEPVKYDSNDEVQTAFSDGVQVSVKNGKVVKFQKDKIQERTIDIRPMLDVYDRQSISDQDMKIGKYLSLYGEAQELIYASNDLTPFPKSYVFKPHECILVQDNTVEHNNLFFMTFEEREKISNEQKYFAVTVYTPYSSRYYESTDLESFYFNADKAIPTYFGEVPCVNYENDDEKQGDAEQIVELSEAFSDLMSDRLTDKRKFIDSVLAIFGTELDSDENESVRENLKKNKMLDGLPIDARIEYIQKVFDEASVKTLSDDLIREIHKMSMTVDMSDEAFSGNITGVALSLKFMPMNFLAKNKIRIMDKGLKARFKLYNYWLSINQNIPIIPTTEVDVVFTIDMPSNLSEMVNVVERLEDRVDEKTLLSLLSFVKDPDEMAKTMEKKKKENRKDYLDSFSFSSDEHEGENEEGNNQVAEDKE